MLKKLSFGGLTPRLKREPSPALPDDSVSTRHGAPSPLKLNSPKPSATTTVDSPAGGGKRKHNNHDKGTASAKVFETKTFFTVDQELVKTKAALVPIDSLEESAWKRLEEWFSKGNEEAAWRNFDETAFELIKILGIVPSEAKFEDYKWIFWTENEMGDRLGRCLSNLVSSERLTVRSSPDYQFRLASIPASSSSSSSPNLNNYSIMKGVQFLKKYAVAIDFGSTHSGVAFASTQPPQTVHYAHVNKITSKQPTCALLDRNLNVIHYGLEAREYFLRTIAGEQLISAFEKDHDLMRDYLYFDGGIKMRLFSSTLDGRRVVERTCTTLSGEHTIPLIDVISKLLEYFKVQVMKDVNKHYRAMTDPLLVAAREGKGQSRPSALSVTSGTGGGVGRSISSASISSEEPLLGPEDVLWVITLPAIWGEEEKGFMRRAARRAGIISSETASNLVLALEPECAIVAAQALDPRFTLSTGDKIMTIDAGGGTTDVSTLEVLTTSKDSSKFTCRHLIVPSGGPWGGQNVDRAFVEFLFGSFLGDQRLETRLKAENQAIFVELLEQFEALKVKMSLEDLQVLTPRFELDLSYVLAAVGTMSLGAYVKAYNSSLKSLPGQGEHLRVSYNTNMLVGGDTKALLLSGTLIKSFFDPTVEAIVEHVRSLFHAHAGELTGLTEILLTGGLSQCPLLKMRFEAAFPNCRVYRCSAKTDLVEFGGVRFGLQPGVINSRRARLTVGVKATVPYDSNVHRGQVYRTNKVYDRKEKAYYVKNMFKPFLVAGEEVEVNRKIVYSFAPRSSEANTVKFELYTCGESRPTISVNDEGCRRFATITVPVTPGAMPTVELSLNVGFTEIIAQIRVLNRETRAEEESRVVLLDFEEYLRNNSSLMPPTAYVDDGGEGFDAVPPGDVPEEGG